MSIGQWLRSYVPPTPVGRSLVSVTITDSVGTGLYLSGSVIYFVKGIGLSAGEVGSALSIAGLAGFLASVPLGMTGDRVGAKRLLVALQLFRGAMLVLLAFVTSFPEFLCAAIALTVAARSVSPATQAVVAGTMSKDDRVATMAIMRSVRNVGYSVGAALTIPIFALGSLWSYRLLMLGNAITFVLSALLLIRVRTPAHIPPVSGRRRYLAGVRDWRFLGLTLVNGSLSLHTSILSVALPLWTLATGGPRWLVSLLLILNTVLAFLLQVASTRGSESPDFGQRSLRRAAVA
ncbi:MAG TPA: MFS transporter, partial [Trebonia sp.]